MTKDVRVRFAPSPTGPLHIGGLRTALFNYLFAKKHNGTFVLRVEDTDQSRFVPNAESYIEDALQWCNIPYDEGPLKPSKYVPYRQSERKSIYKKYALQLIQSGDAYYAFDTAESLESIRTEHQDEGKTFVYNYQSRTKLNNSLSVDPFTVEQKLTNGEPYVIRFKPPTETTLSFKDEIRGAIQVDCNTLDDKILFKSDGMPTYHLANIVDDHLMEITHVIRGEEWLPSLPLHILLYNALDWTPPVFAHLPLILKPTGKGKLGKRDGIKGGFPVFPLQYQDPKTNEYSSGYRESGYLPEAVVNMLAFLGWNPGTEQELFTLTELIDNFSLSNVNKSGAKFDPDKTKWFQQQHVQLKDSNFLINCLKHQLSNQQIDSSLDLTLIIESIRNRAIFLSDLWDLSQFYFIPPTEYDSKALKKAYKEDTSVLLDGLIKLISNLTEFTKDPIERSIKEWITAQEVSFGKIMMPLRLSLVGSLQGPDVFEIVHILGKQETIKRLKSLMNHNS